jgi:hypothetical protein
MKTMIDYQWLENDPALDYENDRRSNFRLSLNQLERRLEYWQQKQEAKHLAMYRAITSL